MISVLTFAKKHPVIFGVSTATVKTLGMDIFVQTQIEGCDKLDWKRVGTFGLFGMIFNGAWQYFLFVKMMPRVVPNAFVFAAKPIKEKLVDVKGIKGLVLQNFVENGINNPVIYFPTFYIIQSFLAGENEIVKTGMNKYFKNFHEDIPAIWALWIPAQFINFGFSPAWFRVPFVAAVSSIWTGYVSMTRGRAN